VETGKGGGRGGEGVKEGGGGEGSYCIQIGTGKLWFL